MPEPQDHIPPSLERWLHIATYDLNDASRARVRGEIIDHFSASVEDQVAQGKARVVAETAALKALGNPFDEALVFCRSYLTQKDMAFLRIFMKVDNGPRAWGLDKKHWFFVGAAAILSYVAGHWRTGDWQETLIYYVAIPFAWLITTLFLVRSVDQYFAGKSLRGRILFCGITLTVVLLVLQGYIRWILLVSQKNPFDMTGLWIFIFWYRGWPVLRKLKSEGNFAFYGGRQPHA